MITFKTNLGDIKIELNFEKAPITAANFQKYVEAGYYNGTIFHRVIKNFMAQGGGFAVGMTEKDKDQDPIKNEADNGLKNDRGTLAMARTQDPHSASAQFFINLADNDFLNHRGKNMQGWGYCVFGRVIEGMDIVDKMTLIATGRSGFHDDVPQEDIVINDTVVA